MPNKNTIKSRRVSVNSTWLKNAMKSVGITSGDIIKDITPNIYNVASASAKTSKSLYDKLKTSDANKLGSILKSNKYVKLANTAYKNALSDIKSGKINNIERESQATAGLMNDDYNINNDNNSGFSFNDDNGDTYDINISNNNDNAVMALSSQLAKNSEAHLKATQASIQSFIAVSAANIQQNNQIGSQLISIGNDINSNLTALIEYNNQNMTRYIESSIAYYDKMGQMFENSEAYTSKTKRSSKINAYDVIGNKGEFDTNAYKNYITQQFKKALGDTKAGQYSDLIKSLTSSGMMDMIVANPLGYTAKAIGGMLIPEVLSTTMKSLETEFTNFVPTFMSQLTGLSKSNSPGLLGTIERFIGTTFGLKNYRIGNFNTATITKGPIPFDAETKHAITEIITKELSEQTTYLRTIAGSVTKTPENKLRRRANRNREFYDYDTNRYITAKDVDKNITNTIMDSMRAAFITTDLGQNINGFINDDTNFKSNRQQKNAVKIFDEIIYQAERYDKPLTISDLASFVGRANVNDIEAKKIIGSYIKSLPKNPENRNLVNSAVRAQFETQSAANRAKESIEDNMSSNYLIHSSYYGDDKDIDKVLAQQKGFNVNNIKGAQGSRVAWIPSSIFDKESKGKVSTYANDMVKSMVKGDLTSFMGNGLNIIGEGVASLDKKFSTVLDPVKKNFDTMGKSIKDGVMEKLFGKVRNEKTGKYENTKGGIFGGIRSHITDGLNKWMDAFFGDTIDGKDDDERHENQKKRIVEALQENSSNSITGAVLGAGVGMVSGGSLLGLLIGGPLGGAALGAATGFLAKNEKFQTYLFGKKDLNGERDGGIISAATQKFFKKNKNFFAGSAALGFGSGALGLSGGGILGALVGGPIGGAMMGLATAMVTRSNFFQKFLFGDIDPNDPEGQKRLNNGYISKVKNAFTNAFNKSKGNKTTGDKNSESKFSLSMATTGALGGGLLGTVVGGPILGAATGLATSIVAGSTNFREFLFGEEDGLKYEGVDENGKKITKTAKKKGVLGIVGSTINTNIVRPIITESKFLIKDFRDTMEFMILKPIGDVIGKGAQGLGGFLGKIFNPIIEPISKAGAYVKQHTFGIFEKISHGIGTGLVTALKVGGGGALKLLRTPFKFSKALLSALGVGKMVGKVVDTVTKPFRVAGNIAIEATKSLAGLAFNAVGHITGGILDMAKGVFGFGKTAVSKVAGGIANAAKKTGGVIMKGADKIGVGDSLRNFGNRFKESWYGTGDFTTDSLTQLFRRNKADYKKSRKANKEEREENRRKDKNAQLMNKYTKGQFSSDTAEAREYLLNTLGRKKYNKLMKNKFKGGPELSASERQEKENNQNVKTIKADVKDATQVLKSSQSTTDKIKDATQIIQDNTVQQTSLIKNIYTMLTQALHPSSITDFFKKDKASTKPSEEDEGLKDKVKEVFNNDESEESPEEGGGSGKGFISMAKRAGAKPYVLGGILKAGLSIVGEKGAELVRKTKDKVQVLSHKASEAALRRREKFGESIKNAFNNSSSASEDANDSDDSISESRSDVRKKARTYNEIFNEKKAEIQQKKDEEDRKEDRKLSEKTANATAAHQSEWSSIFGKTGLVTTGLILLYAWLKKNVLGSSLASLVKNLFGSAFNGIADLLGQAVDTQKDKSRTNGNTIAQQIDKNRKDITNGDILTDAYGNATSQTEGRVKLAANITNKGIQKGKSAIAFGKKAAPYVKRAGKAIVRKADKVTGGKITSIAGKVAEKKGLIKTAVKDKASAVATQAAESKGGKLFTKVKDIVTSVFNKIIDWVTEHGGEKVGKALTKLKGYPKTIMEALSKKWEAFATKVNTVLGGKAALDTSTAGLAEVGFITFGAINGITGTAKLFNVSKKDVDAKMRLISTFLGGFTSSTIGSVLDVAFGFVNDITGIDVLRSVAETLYDILSGGADSESAKKLNDAQKSFRKSYLKDRDKSISKQYKLQKKLGIVDSKVTEKQFKNGVKNGVYKATYKSFADYNTEKNASMVDKISSGVGHVVKGAKNGIINTVKFFKGSRDTYYEYNGYRFTLAKDGDNYDVTEIKTGKKVGQVPKSQIPKDAVMKTKTTKGAFSRAGSAAVGLAKKAFSVGGSLASKGASLVKNMFKVDQKLVDASKKGDINKYLGGTSVVKKNWYMDPQGNIYKYTKGSWHSYSSTGTELSEKIPENRIRSLVSLGYMTKISKTESNKDAKDIETTAKKSKDKKKSSTKSVWSSVGKTVSNVIGGIKSGFSKVASFFGGSGGFGGGFGTGYNMIQGGRGPDTLNGSVYYSQSDSRWANMPYNMGLDNGNMNNTGCGPAAMAMAASDVTGANINPVQMANLAKATGDRDSTGTNWNFINNASSMMGMNVNQTINPTAMDISNSLDQGNPVILSGTSGGSGNGIKMGTPYTPAGHYVVAVGKDNNGNVIVNDPRGKSYSGKYDLNTLANSTGSAWSFNGGRGKGLRRLLPKRILRGGRGTDSNGVDRSQWMNIVKAVKAATAAQNPTYQVGTLTISLGGKSTKMRPDCSGYVSACLYFYGVAPQNAAWTTVDFSNGGSKRMKATGFYHVSWPGWDKLEEGDIISIKKGSRHHVEIFSRNEGGKHLVYSTGSTKGLRNPKDGGDNKPNYTDVWKPCKPGDTSIKTDASVASSSGSEDNSTTSKMDSLFSFMGSAFSEFANRAMLGDFSNTDYSNLLSTGNSDSGDATGGDTAGNYPIDTSEGGTIKNAGASAILRTDIKKLPKLSQSAIKKIINKRLKGKNSVVKESDAPGIYAAQKATGISALALMGIATQESGLGTSSIAKKKYNLWGWNATNVNPSGNAKQWSNVGEAFNGYAYDLNRLYYNKRNEKSLLDISGHGGGAKIGYAFDDSGRPSSKWAPAISNIISSFIGYGLTTPQGGSGRGKKLLGGGFGNANTINVKQPSQSQINSLNTAQSRASSIGASRSSNVSALYTNAPSNNTVYESARRASRYLDNTTDDSIKTLIVSAVKILENIANNTGTTSENLNALKNLSSSTNNIGGTTNNYYVNGSKQSTSSPSLPSSLSNVGNASFNRQDVTAKEIARGGY